MFPVGKKAKSIFHNAHYIVPFKNPRDQLGDLHPASSDQQQLLSHLLKDEGWTCTYQKRCDQTQDAK